jgi:ABC-2 type transport system permease protein
MTRSMAALSGVGAIFKRDLLIFMSYRTRFFSALLSRAVSLILFYYVSRLVTSKTVGSSDDYFAFVVVGLIIFGILTSTLATPVATLRAELQAGTFERMVVSPFGAVRSIASLLAFPLALALLLGLLSLIFAAVAFGLGLHWATVPLAVPVAALGALAFAPFGLAMTAAVVMFKQTNAGATVIITGISLLAGVYFPIALLPHWIQWAADVQPFTPAVDLLRNLLVGTPLRGSAAAELGKLAGFAVVTLPIALLLLRAAVERSRKRGTIIEY